LIVEDEPDHSDTLAELLCLYGHRTQVARTCREAIEALDGFVPDAVLLDIGLPDGDGYWLADALSLLLTHEPLFAVITCRPGLHERSRLAGIRHHFEKPLDLGAVAALLDAHARREG
jgi:DNA-binding response OmpR family regulator